MSRVLGIDIGGSKSRAVLVADGQVVADAEASSASLAAAGPEAAERALASLLAQLPAATPGSLDAVCVGSAGVKIPETRQFLHTRLAPLTVTGTVCIVDDAALVLPAAGLDHGIAVIGGTGSVAVGQWRQHRVQAGGWGYLLGDEGSGYWIARAGLRILLTRRDRGEPGGALATALLTATGSTTIDSLHAAFLRRPQPRHWARFAPDVLDSGDPAAAGLTAAAAAALADLAAAASVQLTARGRAPAALPVVLAGGLMRHDPMRRAVISALAAALPGRTVSALQEPPVAGAVRLAAQAAADQDRG